MEKDKNKKEAAGAMPNGREGTRKRDERLFSIPAKELVDLRLYKGWSFDQIADYYKKQKKWSDLTKMMIYGYFTMLGTENYGGYEPIPLNSLRKYLKSSYTIPEIANLCDVSETGLKNYLADRNLGRTLNLKSVKRMLSEGKTVNYIAKYFGIAHQSVRAWLKRNGLSDEVVLNNTWEKQQKIRKRA